MTLDSTDLELIREARDHIGSASSHRAAISDIEEVIFRHGSNAPAGLQNAKGHLEDGNPDAAIQELESVIEHHG